MAARLSYAIEQSFQAQAFWQVSEGGAGAYAMTSADE